jgi:hypothetical protein
MIETPRTHDLARGNHVVPTEFAEDLERELNEWRNCADRLYNSSGWHDEWPMAVQHYKQLKKKYE